MLNPDFGQRPKVPEDASGPRWVPVRTLIRPGTFGDQLVSRAWDLGERLRPETIFDAVVASLWGNSYSISPTVTTLHAQGIITVKQALAMSEDDIYSLPNSSVLVEKLEAYLRQMMTLPHKRLLRLPAPAPANREDEIRTAVEEEIAKLHFSPYARPVLFALFGLDDGIARNQTETARLVGVKEEKVHLIAKRAKDILQETPGTRERLEGYYVLPEECFGRLYFREAVFVKDLAVPSGTIALSPAAIRKVLHYGSDQEVPDSVPVMKVMITDAKDLTPEIRAEIEEELRTFFARKKLRKASDIEVEKERPETPVVIINRLLEGIELTEEKLALARQTYIGNLPIPDRVYNVLTNSKTKTVADLLELTLPDLRRKVNRTEAGQIGEELQRLFNLPAEEFPPGYLARVLSGREEIEARGSQRQEPMAEQAEKGLAELETLKRMITQAQATGHTTVGEIQLFIKSNRVRNLFGNPIGSWRATALIEYVLNLPDPAPR